MGGGGGGGGGGGPAERAAQINESNQQIGTPRRARFLGGVGGAHHHRLTPALLGVSLTSRF